MGNTAGKVSKGMNEKCIGVKNMYCTYIKPIFTYTHTIPTSIVFIVYEYMCSMIHILVLNA